MQGLEPGRLHPVLPAHLADEEEAVETDLQIGNPGCQRCFETGDESPVLGDVVGGDTDSLATFDNRLAGAVQERKAEGGRTGVARDAPSQ